MRIVFNFKGKDIYVPITNEELMSDLNGTNGFWGDFTLNGVKYQIQLNGISTNHNHCYVVIFYADTGVRVRTQTVSGEIVNENEIHDLYVYPILFHELSEMFLTERIPIDLCISRYSTTSEEDVKMNAELEIIKFIAEHLKPIIGFSISFPIMKSIENIIQQNVVDGNIHIIHESTEIIHAFLVYKKHFVNGSYTIFKDSFISCGWADMNAVINDMNNEIKPTYVLIEDCLFDIKKIMEHM